MKTKDQGEKEDYLARKEAFHLEEEKKKQVLVSGLGFFVLRFERMMDILRGIIKNVFELNGLYERRFVDILMYDSTASSLLNYYVSVMQEQYHSDKDWKDILEFNDIIRKRIREAIKVRNVMMHADLDINTHKVERFFGKRYEVDENSHELINKFKFTTNKELFDDWINTILNISYQLVQVEHNILEKIKPLEGINMEEVKAIKKIEWPKTGEENHRGKRYKRNVAKPIISE